MASGFDRQLIKSVDVFMELADEDIDSLAESAVERMYAPAQKIFVQNEEADAFYIIKAGIVRIQRGSTVLAELRPGSIFGEMGVLDDKPRAASAIAATGVTLLEISKKALFSVIGERRSIEMKIRRKIIERHTANIATTFHRG